MQVNTCTVLVNVRWDRSELCLAGAAGQSHCVSAVYLKWYRTLYVMTEMGFEVESRLHIKIKVLLCELGISAPTTDSGEQISIDGGSWRAIPLISCRDLLRVC